MKKIGLLILIALVALTSCTVKKKSVIPFQSGDSSVGSSDTSVYGLSTGAEVSRIDITPATQTIAANTSSKLKATAIFTDGTKQDVTSLSTWSSNSTGNATVDNTGKVTGVAAGSSGITAVYNGLTGNATITVTAATITGITVSAVTTTITSGASTQYKAIATLSDGTTQDVTDFATWNSSSAGVATVGSTGTVTGAGGGSSTITATFSGISGNAQATVSTATVTSLTIGPAATITKGSTKQYTVTATYSNGVTMDVTNQVTSWSSTDTSIATIYSNGLSLGANAGTTTITASFGGVTATANLTVSPATLVSISIGPNVSVAKGTTKQFTAIGTYSDGTTQDITYNASWATSDANAATVGNAGVLSGLAQGLNQGTTNITASLYGITSSTVVLTVTAPTLNSITVTPSNTSKTKGLTQQYTATGLFSDGSSQNITQDVVWSTSNANASISNAVGSKGLALAANTGSSTITATLGAVSGNTSLTVTAATLVSISVSPAASSVTKTQTKQYTAIGTYSDNSTSDITANVTWSVDAGGAASISNVAGTKGLATGVNAGTATITASLSGVNGSTSLTVNDRTLVSIAVTPATPSKAKGLTQQFTATGTYDAGPTADITANVTWIADSNGDGVDDNSVVSIDNNAGVNKGLGTASNVGTATIKATLGGVSGQTTFTVTAAALTGITVTSPYSSRPKGYTEQFTATGSYTDGTTANITTNVTWSSSNDSILSMDNVTNKGRGTASSSNMGSVTVTATLSGVSGTKDFSVVSAVVTSLTVSPSTASSAVGTTRQYTATGTFSDASVQDITSSVTWKSDSDGNGIDDAIIASISNIAASKGKATMVATGTTVISATVDGISATANLTVTASTGAATTTTATVGSYDVIIPSGLNTSTTPSGNFSGITYNGGTNVAGFVSTIPDYGQTSCSTLGTTILGKILADTPDLVTVSNQVSTSTTNFTGGCTITYNLAVTTNASKKPTELSAHLINQVGVSTSGGSANVSNLTPTGTEVATTSFRVIAQVTYNNNGSELIGIGVTNASDYTANEALLTGFLNGTNLTSAGSALVSKTDSYTAPADPKVDFLWVVDNSGSMAGEQASVQSAATTFFSKLANKHLDYRLGVLTTGSDGTNECSRTLSQHPAGKKAWQLWGTGWTTSADGENAFKSNIGVGTTGCGDESGTFFAKYALENGVQDKNGNSAAIRSGAKVVVVIVSDEGDYYNCWTGGTKVDPDGSGSMNAGEGNPPCTGGTDLLGSAPDYNNYFKTNGHKVYSIIGLSSTTGQPGMCSGSGNAASYLNSEYPNYYNLSGSTGGFASTICTNDYNNTMDSITTSAAAASSTYVLSKTPIASSIVVKVGGVIQTQDATNGWSYNSSSKSIVFSGTAWPAAGSTIEVTYQYDSSVAYSADNNGTNLTAYISNLASDKTSRVALGIALVIGSILLGRGFIRRHKAEV
jgi:hypothetical protein